MEKEIEQYFYEQYEKCGFKLVPGHWPDFKTIEEVDKWFRMAKIVEAMAGIDK